METSAQENTTRDQGVLNTLRHADAQDVSVVRKIDYGSGTHLPLGVKTIQEQRKITQPNKMKRGERPRKIDDILNLSVIKTLDKITARNDDNHHVKNKKKKKNKDALADEHSVTTIKTSDTSTLNEPRDVVDTTSSNLDVDCESVYWRDIPEVSPRCPIFYRNREITFGEWIYNKLISCTIKGGIVYGIPHEIDNKDFFTLHDGTPLVNRFLSLFPLTHNLTFCREWITHNSFSHYRYVSYDSDISDSLIRDYCGHIPTPDLHSNMLSKAMLLNQNVGIEMIQGSVDVAYQYVDISAFRASTLYGITKSRVPRMTYK